MKTIIGWISHFMVTDFTSKMAETTDFSVNAYTTDCLSENLTDSILESVVEPALLIAKDGFIKFLVYFCNCTFISFVRWNVEASNGYFFPYWISLGKITWLVSGTCESASRRHVSRGSAIRHSRSIDSMRPWIGGQVRSTVTNYMSVVVRKSVTIPLGASRK